MVINLSFFGDVLLTNSLCQNIKLNYPSSKVVFLVNKPFYEAAKNQLCVDDVLVFDNLSTGHLETIETLGKYGSLNFVKGDLLDKKSLKSLFEQHQISAVVHFAAFSQVGESVKDPQKYYINNVCGTINLLSAMLEHNVKKIVFFCIYHHGNHDPVIHGADLPDQLQMP